MEQTLFADYAAVALCRWEPDNDHVHNNNNLSAQTNWIHHKECYLPWPGHLDNMVRLLGGWGGGGGEFLGQCNNDRVER